MSYLLLDKHDPKRERDFDLEFLLKLTIKERFELMIRKSNEMKKLLYKNGNRRSPEIIERS